MRSRQYCGPYASCRCLHSRSAGLRSHRAVSAPYPTYSSCADYIFITGVGDVNSWGALPGYSGVRDDLCGDVISGLRPSRAAIAYCLGQKLPVQG